jgi:ribosomal protein S18 acetylase RimI-like enzyme
MAARSEAPLPELVDLLSLGVSDFDPLLAEEIVAWQSRFNWDFRPSADLLRRFLHMRSLQGFGLRVGRNLIGYAYHVLEDRKGLIGDFYVTPAFSNMPTEMMLLGSTVQSLMLKPGIHRIECQLLMLNPPSNAALPFRQFLKRHDRYFMSIDRVAIRSLTPATLKMRVGFSSWSEKFKEEAAHLVAAAYRGHVDSEINDQYRTIPGARHFLLNIIQYPGCGRFSTRSSIVATDESSGRACGMCLSSMVSDTSGHVTQLCVLPGVRGEQIGYELLRLSLLDLVAQGCNDVSLTVTCSNVGAIRLYEQLGFRVKSTFPSLVWEGF